MKIYSRPQPANPPSFVTEDFITPAHSRGRGSRVEKLPGGLDADVVTASTAGWISRRFVLRRWELSDEEILENQRMLQEERKV